MSTFNETNLVKKLESVTSSQDSIQTLSLWVLHHKNHYKKIIDQWLKCYIKAKSNHQLALFYLANDIVQHAKRKNLPHYQNEFMHALREAAKVTNDDKIMNNINRVLKIWQERAVYSKEFIDELKDLLCGEKIKSEVISKIINDFSPNEVINQINNIVKIEQLTRTKYQSLVNCKIDFTNSESLNKLKDKTYGEQFRKELDEATNRLESVIMAIEKENSFRKNLLTNLEKSRIYYAIQMKEAKKIAETFSNCEAGLKQVQNLLKSYGYETSSLNNANQMGTSQLSSVLSIFQQNNNNNSNNCTSVSSLDERLTSLMSGTGKFGLALDHIPHLQGKNLNFNNNNNNNNNMNLPTNFFMTTDNSNNNNKKKEINQIESVITNRPYSLENPLENFEPADMDLGDSEDEERQQQFNYRDVDASKSIASTLPFIGTPEMAGLLPLIPPPPPPPPPPIPPALYQEFIGSSIDNDLGGTFVTSPNVSTIPSIVVDANNFNNNNDNMMRNRLHRNSSSSSSSYQSQQQQHSTHHHSSNQSWRQSPGENTRYNNSNNNNHHRHGQNYHHYNNSNNRHSGGGGGGNRWKNGGGSGGGGGGGSSWKRTNYDHHH